MAEAALHVLSEIETRRLDPEHLRDEAERARERHGALRRIDEVLGRKARVLVRLSFEPENGRPDLLEDLRDEQILVGVREILQPALVVETRRRSDRPLHAVLLEVLRLLGVRLLEEDERRCEAPRLVVRARVEVEAIERLIAVDAIRVLLEQELVLRDRVLRAPRDHRVKLREDEVLLHVVRLHVRRDLERLHGVLRLLESVAIDHAERVPEVVLEVVVPLAREAMQHLAVRALELLPVLLRREDLVDGLERLELSGVEIERTVEVLDRALGVLDLVAQDDADRVRVLRLLTGLRLVASVALVDERRDLLDDLDRRVPVLAALIEHEQLVQDLVVLRLNLVRGRVALDRLRRVLELLVPEVADVLVHLEALLGVRDLEHALLELDHVLPVVRDLVEADDCLERRTVLRVLLEGLVEHVERLAAIVLLALDDAELVEDVGEVFFLQRVAVVDEHHLEVLERVVPALRSVERVRERDERL